jgi:beta-lactamase class A
MLKTYPAEVQKGKIKLAETVRIPNGARVLVTVLDESEGEFWTFASESALAKVWDNTADDIYADLLKK